MSGRRNSDHDHDSLQYRTPRGNIPHRVMVQEIARAPVGGTRNMSQYPHKYKNQEGPKDAKYPLFDDRERPRRFVNNDKGYRPDTLYEYPVVTPDKPSFNYDRKTTPLETVLQPIAPANRARMIEPDQRHNTPGWMRGITSSNKTIVGGIYHPEGNTGDFERARLEPLDRQGREHNRMLHERAQHAPRSPTWPTKSTR
ncbi:hypothetical protein BCIN_09g01020 [Botrytis cinerea B05.10]|uniref:Uncharacterized protein n=1 Tax=Botryotinia fuckeliana (strain B05.10) TaxID=332648 RepID=A0A384JS94_BOTFB|nr:hypothetical protein BCIN_09g01020 [Botrytis cinerea B05.10]ATZ53224.1 hypothetical protein BCIN_09g01020 [Botrytis cinerea B05.10]